MVDLGSLKIKVNNNIHRTRKRLQMTWGPKTVAGVLSAEKVGQWKDHQLKNSIQAPRILLCCCWIKQR
jgi:hypothetical protein